MRKILIIEERQERIEDAKKVFRFIEGYEFTYATSLAEAISLNEHEYYALFQDKDIATSLQRLLKYNGIFTNLIFSESCRIMLRRADIPCISIIDTDTYHYYNILRWRAIFNELRKELRKLY